MMNKQRQWHLAKRNGYAKQFVDREIGNGVSNEIGNSEENAVERKTVRAILEALQNNGIDIDPAVLAEFSNYNSKVESIKKREKDSYK